MKVSIKASWIKDAKIDPETMTEVSGTSMFTDRQQQQQIQEEPEEYEEQVRHA